jgi:hypothetical protein
MEMPTATATTNKAALERRLSNLTVQTMENFCTVKRITGVSGLIKKDLIDGIIERADPEDLENFLSAQEADYLMESFGKAVKWGKSDLLVHIAGDSNMRELRAEFNGLDVGLRRVFYIDFNYISDSRKIRTGCECDDSQERGLFCPHQMAVLMRALAEKRFRLKDWKGPMTAELRSSILALFPDA